MKTSRLLLLPGILLWAAAFTASSSAEEAAALPFNPQSEETVVFLGDSITHQCLYTQYLENFFITRYPDRRIRFINSGVGGDAAADVLARFEDDVEVHEPDYVTLLIGMNDGRFTDYDPEIFATYQEGFRSILQRIQSTGATPVVMSPTMFDHRVADWRSGDETWRFARMTFPENYNALLAYYAGWAMNAAEKNQIAFVQLWGPMNTLTLEQRRQDPRFTMVWDAVHPQASGQLLIASEVLTQLGVEKESASSISIQQQGARWLGSQGVADLAASADAHTLRFRYTAESLPWVIPETEATTELRWLLPSDGRLGYKLTGAGHRLSADRLKVSGLPEGDYEVTIDEAPIGTWSHSELGGGIELQENEKTPQYQQALEVALMNQKRNDEYVRPARDLAAKIKVARSLAKSKPEKFGQRLSDLLSQVRELNQKADEELQRVYEAAQPREHHWAIRKIK